LADVFDALTSARPYKPAYSVEVARRIIGEESGKQFDPVIVAAFEACFEEFRVICAGNKDRLPAHACATSAADDRPANSASPSSLRTTRQGAVPTLAVSMLPPLGEACAATAANPG
jgi:putative two-component system response regulator